MGADCSRINGIRRLAGVPVQYGLYSVPLAVLGYALFGGSRQLFVGPSSTVARARRIHRSHPSPRAARDDFIALTAALSLLVGVLYLIGGLFRLGFIARFFAKPVLEGFIVGLGIYIAVGQLHKVVGLRRPSGDTIEKVWNVMRHVGGWSWTTTAVGLAALALLFGLERISKKVPGAIVVVVIGLDRLEGRRPVGHGVKVVGHRPERVLVRDLVHASPSTTWSHGAWRARHHRRRVRAIDRDHQGVGGRRRREGRTPTRR